jgi:superfamily II DNA or RNA helicase
VPGPLTTFLHSCDWKLRFDEEVLAASRVFVPRVKQAVLHAAANKDAELTALVDGSSCSVTFWGDSTDWDFETRCDCELGSYCHHAAALLSSASKLRDPDSLAGRKPAEAVAVSLPKPAIAQPTPALPEVTQPARLQLQLHREATDRRLRLLLQSLGQPDATEWITAEASVIYGAHRSSLKSAAAHGWTSELSLPDGSRALLRHDGALETAAALQLAQTGLSSLQGNPAWKFLMNLKSREDLTSGTPDLWFPDPSRIEIDAFWHRFRGESVAFLESLGWQVEIDDRVGHVVHPADPDDWDTNLERLDGGWFSLSVGFDVAGVRHDLLPILAGLLEDDFLDETLDRPSQGHIYAPLPNGDALQLPIGRVRRILAHLASLIDPKFPERTRVHALDAAALSGIECLGLDPPPELAELAARLQEFSGIEKTPIPNGLNATLRDYQLAGFHWMQFLARHGLHGILADDMGLGKTLQTITHILAETQSGASGKLPTLVVAPTSVVPNWRAEIQRFAPALRILVLNGPDRRKYLRSIPHADVVLTSYALLHRDIDRLIGHPFHLVVLDEAQNIKNPRAKVAQAACRLDARHRLCLSGTPVENHLGELWSLMRFLIPGFLGSEEHFDSTFRRPIEKNGDAERNAILKQRIAPLILRRTKDQVAKELPPKTELIHLIELSTAQKDLYETVRATMNKRVREAIAARGGGQYQIVFLDALLKLRQICCDPRLLPAEFSNDIRESAKLDYLADLLRVLIEEGRRILLFSQFTSMLALIEEHLNREKIPYLILTGSSKDRGKLVEDFQSGSVPLFLISLKAGGTGLNLTAADTVIHYDPWWNPAAQAQATDRACRIGQKNPVFVHKLLCQDTVEQRIHQLQQDKAKLAADLLADADISQKLSPEMVRALLE